MSGSIVPPGVAQVIATLQDLVRASYANTAALNTLVPALWQPPRYAVASLPAVTAANAGQLAFATNARNPGEGAGAGTGCLVTINSAGVWFAVWSGVAPAT